MKAVWTSVLVASFMVSNITWANPVSSEVVRARQVPKTLHVQFTYGTHDATIPTINKLTRDGNAVSGSWSTLDSFTTNTGSGLASVKGTQFCDCNVTKGKHDYKLEYKVADKVSTMEVSLTVVEDLPEPEKLDAGAAGKDMMAWDIPDPVAIQGVDCIKVCKLSELPDAGASKKDTGVTVDLASTSTSKETKDDSGCSVSGGAQTSGLAFLLSLALLLLVRRRQR
jgi:MYXO-CTERM domain-containing protein